MHCYKNNGLIQLLKEIKGRWKKLQAKEKEKEEMCLIEYPIMLISGGEMYLKLIFQRENGSVDVVELYLDSNNSLPCIQKSLQFSDEKHCVVFEKRRIPTGFIHGVTSYEYVFKMAFIKKQQDYKVISEAFSV